MQLSQRHRKTRIIIAGILLIGAGMQLIKPGFDNPPVTGRMAAPDEVVHLFERACYDCHSNETKLEWYDKIAPASWIVSSDVKEGRRRFNFSRWDTLSPKERQTILWETVNAAIGGKMPLKSYSILHSPGRLSTADIEVLKKYVNSLPNNRPANDSVKAAAVRAADEEFSDYRCKNKKWDSLQPDMHGMRDSLPVALNGVRYVGGYKYWTVISTTQRIDNYTMRIIYGNDIAVNAIRENNIHPFPNGAEIVKVVWDKIEERDGSVRPGTFNAEQIMIKDDNRYPKTGGWGFAIFSGLKLLPAGKTPLFEMTCFNCHKLNASENGYVFNLPIEKNEKGPGAKSILFDAGGQRVITSSLNQKTHTMSILYGNGAACQAALGGGDKHEKGEVFTLVTWEQALNPHWYGSYINGRIQSVERVNILQSLTGDVVAEYKVLKGDSPKDENRHTIDWHERIGLMLKQRPSVFP